MLNVAAKFEKSGEVTVRYTLFLAGILLLNTALADDPYLTGTLRYIEPDNSRLTDDGLGFGLAYGWRWRERLYPEINLYGTVLDTGNSGGSDFYQLGGGADLRYELTKTNWRPFVIGGVGIVRNDVVPDSMDSTDVYANAGIGILSPPLKFDLRLRAEARLYLDTFEDNQTDMHIGIGVQIPSAASKLSWKFAKSRKWFTLRLSAIATETASRMISTNALLPSPGQPSTKSAVSLVRRWYWTALTSSSTQPG